MLTPSKHPGKYKIAFSRDPAIQLPDGDDEASNAIRVAHETGDWSSLIREGHQPTFFVFTPIDHEAFAAWRRLKDEHGNTIHPSSEGWSILARAALIGVENFGAIEVVRTPCDRIGGAFAADPKIWNSIPIEIRNEVVEELGLSVYAQETTTRKK